MLSYYLSTLPSPSSLRSTMSAPPPSADCSTMEMPTKSIGRRLGAISIASTLVPPTGKDNEKTGVVSSTPTISDKEVALICTYFAERKARDLKEICKVWKLRETGKKSVLVSRCCIHVLDNGKPDYASFVSSNSRCRDCEVACTKFKSIKNPTVLALRADAKDLHVAPTDRHEFGNVEATLSTSRKKLREQEEVLDLTGDGDGDGDGAEHDGGEQEKITSTYFSLAEYARLLVILRDNQDAREALEKSKQVLSVAEIDARVAENEWWKTIVEPIFNDDSYKPRVVLSGMLTDIDPSKSPPVYRYSGTLAEKFRELCGRFTACLSRWSGTGNSDPDSIHNYCKDSRGRVTAEFQRVILLFHVCKLNTTSPDGKFVELTNKLMKIVKKKGLELGLNGGSERDDLRDTLSIPSTYGRKRKRMSDVEKEHNEGIKGIVMALNRLAPPERDRDMDSLRKQAELMKMLSEAQGTLKLAKELQNEDMIGMAEAHIKGLTESFNQSSQSKGPS